MSTSTYNPYTPTTTAAYVAHYAHAAPGSLPTQSTPLPYFPALTQHYASLSQQHTTQPDQLPHQHPEQHQPDLTSITPSVASRALRALLTYELRHAGFDSAQCLALTTIEREVIAFLDHLFKRAHNYANLANRAGPIAPDLLLACQDLHIPLMDVRKARQRGSKEKRENGTVKSSVPTLLPARPRSPSPELLPSDDDEAGPMVPLTLRGLPTYFPELPPKHTYLRTPASPPKKAALPSLEKKTQNCSFGARVTKELADSHRRKYQSRRRRTARSCCKLGDGRTSQKEVENHENPSFINPSFIMPSVYAPRHVL